MATWTQTFMLTFEVEAENIDEAGDRIWDIALEEIGRDIAKNCAYSEIEEK